MGKLHKTTLLRYIAVILLLGILIALQVFKKKEPQPAQDETQNALVKSDTQQVIAGDKIPLKILYVGLPNTERQKDFVSFLSENFQEAKTADLYAFKEEQTNNSDVIILDKDGIQWAGRGDGKPLMNILQVDPVFKRMAEKRGFYSKKLEKQIAKIGSIQKIDEIPAGLRRIFRGAYDIKPQWHIRMQAAFQQHCDAAVSKTINFSEKATISAVDKAYKMAYSLGCKGVTVYRQHSRKYQPMSLY